MAMTGATEGAEARLADAGGELAFGLDAPLHEVMRTMRAIRRLRPDPVDDELLEQLVQAATWAPSASTLQAYSWLIVTDHRADAPARRYPGRRALPDRLALNGILHVLHTGIAWRDLPLEFGYGSGVTCWRRLRDWQAAGVWDALHQQLLVKLNAAGAIDWSRAAVDGSHVPAFWGAPDGAIPG